MFLYTGVACLTDNDLDPNLLLIKAQGNRNLNYRVQDKKSKLDSVNKRITFGFIL